MAGKTPGISLLIQVRHDDIRRPTDGETISYGGSRSKGGGIEGGGGLGIPSRMGEPGNHEFPGDQEYMDGTGGAALILVRPTWSAVA
jgi:hypothetical protein